MRPEPRNDAPAPIVIASVEPEKYGRVENMPVPIPDKPKVSLNPARGLIGFN